jgi:hypothetical protein
VRGASQSLSLQGNDGGPVLPRALPAPCAKARVDVPHWRAPRQNRRAFASKAPNAALCRRHRPGLFARRPATAASGTISALFFQARDSASPTATRDHHSERRDQPKLTFCKWAKSQSWKCPPERLRKRVRQGSRGLGARAFSQFTSLAASGRRRSPRTRPADPAEEGPGIRTDARRL